MGLYLEVKKREEKNKSSKANACYGKIGRCMERREHSDVPTQPWPCGFSILSWPRKGEEPRSGGGSVVTRLEMTKKNRCEGSNGKQVGTALLESKSNFIL